MTAETPDLPPNMRPNYVLAGAVLLLGVVMGWLAFDFARMLGFNAVLRDYRFLAVMVAIVLLLLAAAWRLFTRPFGARSAITFGPDAIVFDHWGPWRSRRTLAIPRQEIVAFWVANAPYTQQFSVEITQSHAVEIGMRQPTTRQNSAFVPAPKFSLSGYGFHDPMPVVLDTLRADLARFGLTLGAANADRSLPLGNRWPVVAV